MNHLINRRIYINNIFKNISTKLNVEQYSINNGVSLTSVLLYNMLSPLAMKEEREEKILKIKSNLEENGLNLVPILDKSSIIWGDCSSEIFRFLKKHGYNEEYFDPNSMPYHRWDKIDDGCIREVANIGQQINYFVESGKLLRFDRYFPDLYKESIESTSNMYPELTDDLTRLFLITDRTAENYLNSILNELRKILNTLNINLSDVNGIYDSEKNDVTNILKKYI